MVLNVTNITYTIKPSELTIRFDGGNFQILDLTSISQLEINVSCNDSDYPDSNQEYNFTWKCEIGNTNIDCLNTSGLVLITVDNAN